MEQNFSSLKLPTVGATAGASTNGVNWANPTRITADDGSSATYSAAGFGGDFGATIRGSSFAFQQLPPSAVIDGIQVNIDGAQFSAYGTVDLSVAGAVAKDMTTLNTSYGGATDLWGLDSITPAQIAALYVDVVVGDVSGGDATASIDYMSVTVFWHIELTGSEADVPTRVDYKVFSRAGRFLGLLPNVSSILAFPQDINSAGSSLIITSGQFVNNEVTVTPLLTEAGDVITTEDDQPILATETEIVAATGDSVDDAIFKNSNEIQAWLYNEYYPNGKRMFSGQVNRVEFKYGGGDSAVKLTVWSDGFDLNNYIARGYPFVYTEDNIQTVWNDVLNVRQDGDKGAGWERYGQTFTTGAAVTNIGAILLALQGTADVTVSVYDAPNGNLLGSVEKAVSNGAMTQTQFEFPALIPASPSTSYFFGLSVRPGQLIKAQFTNVSAYSGGNMWNSVYSGGSGGGTWGSLTYDLYFVTKYGAPTTTVTYTADDPVSEMAHGIFLDYNSRGGNITERDFDATGLSLTYTFVVATIFDALKKVIELCPTGYYSYIDLGTAEIDIKTINSVADFTIVRGRHINELNIALSIEQVKNYLLLSGGNIGGGVNLFRDYPDNESMSNYGVRTVTKSDNRITLNATADAIGDTFIEENSDEQQETSVTVLNTAMDITLLTPGKTIGFRNFGNFIDDMVVQIVRREYQPHAVKLTLGRLPVRMNDDVQRITRDMTNQQTIANPTAPT